MVKFYNVKKRESVEVDESSCYKVVYKKETKKGVQERYAVRAKDDDGTNLTKFINKATFDSLSCPQQ
ncbi:MAG: hypothetical protein K9L78_04930 [Victivallales bacterium]|nr:hypothetical protein [Victivallales bacterium]MCF7889447.1 hypothetical protein [Victivallales bacterium]